MSTDKREREIEEAAYKVLAEKGFKGASMLAVARAAHASNETLYKWYGDKVGLFSAMIARNAAAVESELQRVRETGGTGLEALDAVGRALLGMVTGARAVALNRAAAGDISGVLGEALAQGGRARVAPLIAGVLQEAYGDQTDLSEKAETYIALLLGDVQIRRATGGLPPLSEYEITARADRAMMQFKVLYPL